MSDMLYVSGYSEDGYEGFILKVNGTIDLKKRVKVINRHRKKQHKKPIIECRTHGKGAKVFELT